MEHAAHEIEGIIEANADFSTGKAEVKFADTKNSSEVIAKKIKTMKLKTFSLRNYRTIPQIKQLSEESKRNIEIVGSVLPFKLNNYVIGELIDWANYENDPIFNLTFPQKEMLSPHHFDEMAAALEQSTNKKFQQEVSHKIRLQLNPNPAGQKDYNLE